MDTSRVNCPIDARLLEEAANWVLIQRFDHYGQKEEKKFKRWHSQSPAHAAAWQQALGVLQSFQQVPSSIGKSTLQTLSSMKRRRLVRTLCTAGILLPAGWLIARHAAWHGWSATMRTETGESQSFVLADGTSLLLNTASAADVVYTPAERRILLHHGEILVATHADSQEPARPLHVETPHGLIQALGTRFSVRRLNADRHLAAVYEHAVAIQPVDGPGLTLTAGWQATFDRSGVATPAPLDDPSASWQHGMLLAKDMRLADVIHELGRYRTGVLRCHPDLADLRISGAISLKNTDAALELLARRFPLRIGRMTKYWISVEPV